MQIWKWVLAIGLLFLITYNPSTRTLANFFEGPMVEGGRHGGPTYAREAQIDSDSGDDDREPPSYAHRTR